MLTRQQWQKLASDNGKLLERVIKEKPEMIAGIIASIERCNEQAASTREVKSDS